MKWSYSDSNTFYHCRRLYYLSDILANANARDSLRRRAYYIKNSMNFEMWAGHIVDKFMSKVLIPDINEGITIDFEVYAENAVEIGKKQFDFSKNGLYKNHTKTENTIDYCVLDIHELQLEYEEKQIEEVYEKVRQVVLNIPNIKMFNTQVSLYEYLLRNKGYLFPDITTTGFKIDEINIFPQIDLRISEHTIIDWKVSQSHISDYKRQMSIIGVAIHRSRKKRNETGENPRKLDYGDIVIIEVNLLKGTITQHKFTEDIANNTYDHIYLNAKDISLLRSPECKPSYETMMRFEQIEGDCSRCKFYNLCTHLTVNKHNYNESEYLRTLAD
jgi:hypothetical protein